jgi:hypothetical protein
MDGPAHLSWVSWPLTRCRADPYIAALRVGLRPLSPLEFGFMASAKLLRSPVVWARLANNKDVSLGLAWRDLVDVRIARGEGGGV